MIYIAGIILLLLLMFGPKIWADQLMKKYSEEIDSLPGTGGELAKHLAEKLGLEGVKIEPTQGGDHYDPVHRAVRLSEKMVYNKKSLTSIVIAAHEIGHALQHARGYKPLITRTKLAGIANSAQKIASFAFVVAPVAFALLKIPSVALFLIAGALISLLVSLLLHIVTLPVEFDASFNRALPILKGGGYITSDEVAPAKKLLLACALTYFSSALAGLLNLGRYLAPLLRRF